MFRSAGGAFSIFANCIETALVERVFAEKVDRREVERSIAGRTATRLEYDGLGTKLFKLLHLRFGFGAVA
jgi:hypothetical protein